MRHRSKDTLSRQPIHGFTLVELLVVISIIALLVSILMPALNKARQQAYRVQCLANVRQIGLGITMYTNDWNDWYPPQTWSWSGSVTYFNSWRDPLVPYFNGSLDIFYCPVGGKIWGVNSYRLRPRVGKPVYSWKLNDFGSPALFMLLQDTSPRSYANKLVHGTQSLPKEFYPQLFADIHAELGGWLDIFNEGW